MSKSYSVTMVMDFDGETQEVTVFAKNRTEAMKFARPKAEREFGDVVKRFLSVRLAA